MLDSIDVIPPNSGDQNDPIVIIGNGMVGHHLVCELSNQNPNNNLVVVGEEPEPAYDRVHLSQLFAGESPQSLTLDGADKYEAVSYTHLTLPTIYSV